MNQMIIQLTFLIIASSITINATAQNENISCPPAQLVKQSWMLLDTVTALIRPKFVISSQLSTLQDANHRSWNIVVYVDAEHMNSAFKQGQSIIKNITSLKQKYAFNKDDLYLCLYKNPNSSLSISLVSDKNEYVQKLKMTSINLNLK